MVGFQVWQQKGKPIKRVSESSPVPRRELSENKYDHNKSIKLYSIRVIDFWDFRFFNLVANLCLQRLPKGRTFKNLLCFKDWSLKDGNRYGKTKKEKKIKDNMFYSLLLICNECEFVGNYEEQEKHLCNPLTPISR